jgi:hypothetical protein
MDALPPDQPAKRRLLGLAALLPWTAWCSAAAPLMSGNGDPHERFRGISLTLVVDAVPGAEMEGVIFYEDRGWIIYAKSLVARRTREIMGLGSPRIPLTVRVIWRDKPTPVWGRLGGIEYEGTIIGDYTISVAERIPDEVLSDIRAHGGGLRLKFRLKPDGVLFGWDIERPDFDVSKFDMPGGDFLETRY